MKKLLAFLLVAMMVFSLAACGGKDDGKTPSGNNDPQQSSQQQEREPSNTPDPGNDNKGGSSAANQVTYDWPTEEYITDTMTYKGAGDIVFHNTNDNVFKMDKEEVELVTVYINGATLDDVRAYVETLKNDGFGVATEEEALDTKGKWDIDLTNQDTGLEVWVWYYEELNKGSKPVSKGSSQWVSYEYNLKLELFK